MKIRYIYSGWNGKNFEYEIWEYLDPQAYESSENDPLAEREEARINQIVWGKKVYLKPTVIEGSFRAD